MVENRTVVDSQWEERPAYDDVPKCDCCEEKIKQFRALHILSGNSWVWICDRCIEDLKEATGW